MFTKTPAERGILYYLQLRQLEGAGGASQKTIFEETGLSERTIGTAIRKLMKAGDIK